MRVKRLLVLISISTLFFTVRTAMAQRAPEIPQAAASLPCGTINPHLQYMVTADTGQDRSGGVDKFDALTANTNLKEAVDDGFPSNGQGAARGTVQGLCTLVFPGDEHNVYTKLNITTIIFAQGGCCGGLQPGGQAYAQPEWQSSLILPGDQDDSWTLKVALDTNLTMDDPGDPKPSGMCTLSIDGNATGHELDVSKPNASFSEHLSPGPHALEFQCPQYGLNIRGAGRVFSHTVTIGQTLYLSGSKAETKRHKT